MGYWGVNIAIFSVTWLFKGPKCVSKLAKHHLLHLRLGVLTWSTVISDDLECPYLTAFEKILDSCFSCKKS